MNMIRYFPHFNQVTRSINASLLLGRIIELTEENNGDPFFKFQVPCAHEKYEQGQSWSEDLGFTKKEFATAISKVGTKITKSSIMTEVLNGTTAQHLVIYWTDSQRVTWYKLNSDLAKLLLVQ